MAIGFVRPARPGDAVEVARIQLATWRIAYRRLLPRSVLANLDEAWTTDRWLEAIVAPPTGRHRVLVAVEQPDPGSAAGEAASAYLVGFAAIGPTDEAALAPGETPADLGKGVASITELLVEPRWGRRGHGSRLLSACVDLCRADRFTSAVCWTFVDDQATGRFLESAGWAADGARRSLDVDDLLVPQLRRHTSISIDRTGLDVTSA
jgi:GNAT superfamily N-acetyltransferase